MVLRPNFLKQYLQIRYFATKTNVIIATTNDESTYAVWHPKEDFPYECTNPLPETVEAKSTSPLKTQYTPKMYEVFNKKHSGFARQELMNITHTCMHRWFPRARDKKAKKTEMDREYI